MVLTEIAVQKPKEQLSKEEIAEGLFRIGLFDISYKGSILRIVCIYDQTKPYPFRLSTYRPTTERKGEEDFKYTGGQHAKSALSAFEGLVKTNKELAQPIHDAVINAKNRSGQ